MSTNWINTHSLEHMSIQITTEWNPTHNHPTNKIMRSKTGWICVPITHPNKITKSKSQLKIFLLMRLETALIHSPRKHIQQNHHITKSQIIKFLQTRLKADYTDSHQEKLTIQVTIEQTPIHKTPNEIERKLIELTSTKIHPIQISLLNKTQFTIYSPISKNPSQEIEMDSPPTMAKRVLCVLQWAKPNHIRWSSARHQWADPPIWAAPRRESLQGTQCYLRGPLPHPSAQSPSGCNWESFLSLVIDCQRDNQFQQPIAPTSPLRKPTICCWWRPQISPWIDALLPKKNFQLKNTPVGRNYRLKN